MKTFKPQKLTDDSPSFQTNDTFNFVFERTSLSNKKNSFSNTIVRNEQLGSVLLLFFLVNWLVVLFGFFSLNIQEKFKIFFMLYAMLFQCFIKFKFSLVKIMISCELHFSNILINCSPFLF